MGQLTATGGYNVAGIGGGFYTSGSNITINGGIVEATGGFSAAGIGGGYHQSGSNITINGGVVTATGGTYGAGIGGGSSGSGSNITINGGVVTATGGMSAAGIGGGDEGSGTNIKIATTLQIKADNNNPPTTEIENDGGDLASSLTGKRYAVLHDLLPDIKEAAIAAIDAAIVGVTDETILAIATQAKTDINAATTIESVNSIKDKALAKINAIVLIQTARQGIQNTEINSMIDDEVTAIANATTMEQVTDSNLKAMTIISIFQNGIEEGDAAGYTRGKEEGDAAGYTRGKEEGIEEGKAAGKAEMKAELLGDMGEECTDCTAVEVTNGTTTVILYKPTNVGYIKITE